MKNKKPARSVAAIFQKQRKALGRRLRKIKAKLQTESRQERQGALAQEAVAIDKQIKELLAKLHDLQKIEQRNRLIRAQAIEDHHKRSGYTKIRAREVSGGLPSLGRKK